MSDLYRSEIQVYKNLKNVENSAGSMSPFCVYAAKLRGDCAIDLRSDLKNTIFAKKV